MRLHPALLSLAALLPAFSSAIHAQPSTPHFASLAPIAFNTTGPVIRAHTEALKPFTVAGEHGVLLGQQDGAFEAWVLPVKLLSHMTIEANIDGFTVPIDVNQQSAEIEVRPDRTVITYSHIGFTVRQIMFSPNDPVPGAGAFTGPIVLFEFDCLHPTDFTFRFTPNLEYMWPERNEGHPGPEWVAPGANQRAGGFYVLHADYPDLAGAVTIPGAEPGIMAPYQERPQIHPVELKLHIDPARDHGRLFPLLMAVGTNQQAAATRTLGDTLEKLNQTIPAAYTAHAESYKKLLANSVSIDTPDKALNEAFQWAEIAIEQLKAKPFCDTTAPHDAPSRPPCTDETGLVAGYYASGDSARPGFGWFFGRDALYTLYAVNGYGNFALSRSELEFLIRRQRADGKIMHEYSQTATQIDWLQFPYMYAAADSTPLFLLAMLDYVRSSGDVDFLRAHKDAVEKAWAFETDPAHDTDHDGIYDNSQGTGWVESWPGAMPHQEIYLAELDQQASDAYAQMQAMLGNARDSNAAGLRAQTIAATIEKEYYDPQTGCYAFATNPAGSPNSPQDRTVTVYPALAWWSGFTAQPLAHGDKCLQQLAEHTLNTDWGLRDVSNDEKIYDGMSYHQGSVWPLFTGWAALAEYRGNQPLAGYQMLKENANLTWAQDLGSNTELLSGDYYVPFGRSTSHQLWSSAMVITPTLRGLFGISIDAQTKTITVNPHLPADWKRATIQNLRLPDGLVGLSFFEGSDGRLVVSFTGRVAGSWHLRSDVKGSIPREGDTATSGSVLMPPSVSIPLLPIQVALIDSTLPVSGERPSQPRVLTEQDGDHNTVITMEGVGGSSAKFLIANHANANLHLQPLSEPTASDHQSGGSVVMLASGANHSRLDELKVHFAEGEGWKTITVTLTW